MPRGDGTGPAGLGPMTGRGLGYCAGFNRPGYMTPGFGWARAWGWNPRFGWRRGWGRGWGYPSWGYPLYPTQPPTASEEKELLKEELQALKEEMKAIEERLKELETKD